jgi:hypothetical protein
MHKAGPLFPIHMIGLTRSRRAWRCVAELLEQGSHS